MVAWSKKEICFKGARIYLDHDFTTKVKEQRASYRLVWEQLRKQQVKSHILAPAKLKVFNKDGMATIYSSAELARKDLERKGFYKSDGVTETEREAAT